ncbi:protein of unknown function (plasmid) [Cupriavidus taiwanensis]|nr:hypothetical protein CBM2621_B10290 [Cupriavidus taiwanensis]SPD55920.1 protein of unknown function [Cupriavidus taiwanensis]
MSYRSVPGLLYGAGLPHRAGQPAAGGTTVAGALEWWLNEPRAVGGRLLRALSEERLRLLRRQYRGA